MLHRRLCVSAVDGSDPKYGKTYTEPVAIPADAVLIQAIAEREDLWSNKIELKPPHARPTGRRAQPDAGIDLEKPAVWKISLSRTGRKEAFDVIGLLKKYSARVRGFRWAFNAVNDHLLCAAGR